MPDTIRAFVAFELPQRVIASIEEIQNLLREYGFNMRWVRPKNIHLTLKFLGNIKTADVETVGDAVEKAVGGFAPLSLEVRGVGVFPDLRRPRVLWTGIAGQTTELKQLQNAIENGLHAIGFPKEARPFKEHLTLGRVKGPLERKTLQQALEAHTDFQSGPFTVDRVFVYKSDLKPSGPEYTKLSVIEISEEKIS